MTEVVKTNWRYSYTSVPPTEGDNDTPPRTSLPLGDVCSDVGAGDADQWSAERNDNGMDTSKPAAPERPADGTPVPAPAKYWLQYAATVSATLTMFASGIHFGWIGPTMPRLLAEDSLIPTSSSQSSWVAGLLQVGAMPGPIIGAVIADCWGRRTATIFTAGPFLLASLLIAFAPDIYTLYAARFVTGLAVGASFAVIPMYIGEISSPPIRGFLGSLINMQCNFGIFLQYCLVPFVSIQCNALITLAIPVLLFASACWMPETPYFHLMKNREADAVRSLQRLRQQRDVSEEMLTMKLALKEQREDKGSFFDLFTIRSNRKALLLILLMLTAQQASGISAIVAYSQIIFEQANAAISADASGIILSFSSFFVTFITSMLVDRWGRRPLLIISAFTTAIPLIAIGIFFYLRSIHYQYISSLSLIPIIALGAYKFTFGIGIGSMPYICVSELFPTNVKAFATCTVSVFGSIGGFVATKLYQIIADAFGVHTAFGVFAVSCIICGVLLYLTVPETKGKTLEEIQADLKYTKQENSKL